MRDVVLASVEEVQSMGYTLAEFISLVDEKFSPYKHDDYIFISNLPYLMRPIIQEQLTDPNQILIMTNDRKDNVFERIRGYYRFTHVVCLDMLQVNYYAGKHYGAGLLLTPANKVSFKHKKDCEL